MDRPLSAIEPASRLSTHPAVCSVLVALVALAPFLQACRLLEQANENFQIGMDFRLTYTAAAAWLQGADAYDDATLKDIWKSRGMPHATPPGLPQTPNVYPLSVAPLLSPLALLNFPDALAVWLAVNAGCIAVLGIQLIRSSAAVARLPIAAAALFLLGFPLRYGFVFGNLTILATFLIVQALRNLDRPVRSGVCFGLALVKYSVCAPLVFFLAFTRHRRVVLIAGTVQIGLISAASLGFYRGSWMGWIEPMYASISRSLKPGEANHFASLEYTSLHLELSTLLHRIHPALDSLRHVLVAALLLAAAAALIRHSRRQNRSGQDAIHLADPRPIAILAVTLLAFYHRTYDLIAVIVPLLTWLVVAHDAIPRRVRGILWVSAGLTVLPGAAFRGGSPNVGWPALAFVQPLAAWALLGMAVVVIRYLFHGPMAAVGGGDSRLFKPKRFDRIQPAGAPRRVEPEEETRDKGEAQGNTGDP